MVQINLKEKLNKYSDFISIWQIFDEIREKTNLKNDYEIAESLIPVVKECTAYNRYEADDGKPRRLFGRNPSDPNTDLDYKLMLIASGKLQANENQIFNNYALYKSDFYYEFDKFHSCDLENEDIDKNTQENTELLNIPFDEAIKKAENDLEKVSILYPTINYTESHLRPLFIADFFTIVEAACLISGDDPVKMNTLIESGDLNYKSHYANHSQAVKTIERAILAKNLELKSDYITRESLQNYLLNKGLTIQNFNADIAMELLSKSKSAEQKAMEHYQQHDQLLLENEKLKAELLRVQERIKQIEQQGNAVHPSLDKNHQNHAPELKLAFELWEEIYVNGRYVESHSKSVEQLLCERGYEVRSTKTYDLTNLAKRIIAITNKK